MQMTRVRFTLTTMMLSIAVLAVGMGSVVLFIRSSGMSPAHLGVLIGSLVTWAVAVYIVAFSLLWLLKLGSEPSAVVSIIKAIQSPNSKLGCGR